MKKYFLGLFVIASAIATSSFTSSTGNESEDLSPLHWYKYDSGADQLTVYYGSVERSSAVTQSGCQDAGNTQCARGYTSQQSGTLPIDEPAAGADFINKN